MTEEYAVSFTSAVMAKVMNAHKRNNPMTKEEAQDLSRRIVNNKRAWSFADIKLFGDMLIDCQLGDSLKSVDISAIMEKVKEYERQRNETLAEMQPSEVDTFHDNWEYPDMRPYEPILNSLSAEQRAQFYADWADENARMYNELMNGKKNRYFIRQVREGVDVYIIRRLAGQIPAPSARVMTF